MCFGNNIGFRFDNDIQVESIFKEDYGSIVMEIDNCILQEIIKDNINIVVLGNT